MIYYIGSLASVLTVDRYLVLPSIFLLIKIAFENVEISNVMSSVGDQMQSTTVVCISCLK